jgi:hypothetical protein
MATGEQVLLRQRQCRDGSCGAVFYLCRSCDRGQRYCSERCREKSRREQRRVANRRHQRSDEGRLDHRDRQREYRLRLVMRVTDHGSGGEVPSSTLRALTEWPFEAEAGEVFCRLCGRRGTLVDPFAG